jgi:SEC-C motif-containing protein
MVEMRPLFCLKRHFFQDDSVRECIALGNMPRMSKTENDCPCGSGREYADCCGLFHRGAIAPDAEALMRSRYSAFALDLEPYLLATWHPDTRPASLNLAAEPAMKWLGLDVKRHEQSDADHAIVEFVACYKVNGRAHRLHEVSRFVREGGRWLYLDAEFPGHA